MWKLISIHTAGINARVNIKYSSKWKKVYINTYIYFFLTLSKPLYIYIYDTVFGTNVDN